MRAVLDRPHRSNFVSVSTAVNRVAKLAASRRRGGGLKGEEEPKYLGVLLKVRVSCEASGGELTDSVCCSVLAVRVCSGRKRAHRRLVDISLDKPTIHALHLPSLRSRRSLWTRTS